MKLFIKISIISFNVLVISALEVDQSQHFKHDYEMRISQPLTIENYEKY